MTRPLIKVAESLLPARLTAALRHSRHARARAALPLVRTAWGFEFAGAVPDTTEADEAAHVRALSRLIDAADVFVDVGANVGFFTCLARARGKAVIAVEPFPLNITSISRNLAANGWTDVEVHRVALADRAGEGTLYGRDTLASRVKGWAVADDSWRQPIALTTLDALLDARFAGSRLAIKIDVEGGEHDVLRGASQTLTRTPAPIWAVEIAFDENHPGGSNPHFLATFELFFSHDYAATTVAGEGERQVTPADVRAWVAQRRRGFGTMNYSFRRPE
jgi:FkbM family methyltransferase